MSESVADGADGMGPAPALIHIQNVHKRFGRKWILRGAGLEVARGEVVALLGANGAGKTTLMRIIAGLSKPDRGIIQLDGVHLQRASHEIRRYIGLVSHAPLLYEGLSGLENLQFFGRMYDVQDAADRIEALLRIVDLWRRRMDPVRTYSRGMTQRLTIARAILHDPPALLLDEPDTGLDQASTEMLRTLLRQLDSADRAVLLTTHNLDRAIAWADRVCLLWDGTIAFNVPTVGLDIQMLQLACEQGAFPASYRPV